MINIDLHNYELYVIDFIEGNLNDSHRESFELFLRDNPEIKNEVFELSTSEFKYLAEENYNSKTELKKGALLSEPINENNYIQYFIAFHENDLDEATKQSVINFVDNSKTKIEFDSIKRLRFKEDNSIKFPLKQEIKKSTPRLILYQSLRIAASVIILLGVAWYLTLSKSVEQQYSQREKPRFNELLKPDKVENIYFVESQSKEEKRIIPNITHNDSNYYKIIVPNKYTKPIAVERNPSITITSISVKTTTIKQELNAGHIEFEVKSEVVVAEAESVLKLNFPKIFKNRNGESDDQSTILRANYNLGKREKDSNHKTFVNLGQLKVYKKKGGITSASVDSKNNGNLNN